MDEGTSKAIPLRRSRANGTRAVATRADQGQSWTARLGGGVQLALEPPRQVWLAGLGSTAITVRGVRALWDLLVSEGAATQTWLRRSLRRADAS